MLSKFNIYQSSTEEDRPPISHKVREYLLFFTTKNVLEKKNVLLNAKWNVILSIYFVRKRMYGPECVFLAKGSRTVSSENTKIFEVIVPVQTIDDSADKHLRTIELMYEAIALYLTTTYKKITKEFMSQLWQEVDLSYLLSLPYPAPFKEQKYLIDELIERQPPLTEASQKQG